MRKTNDVATVSDGTTAVQKVVIHRVLTVLMSDVKMDSNDDGGFACVPGTCLYQQRQLTVHRMFLS